MKHELTPEDRSKGGKVRSKQESFKDGCSAGFWATVEKHPYFARNHLRKLIKGDKKHKPVKKEEQ